MTPVKELRDEIAMLKGTVKELRDEIAMLKGTVKELRDETAMLKGRVKELRDETAMLKGRSEKDAAENAGLREALSEGDPATADGRRGPACHDNPRSPPSGDPAPARRRRAGARTAGGPGGPKPGKKTRPKIPTFKATELVPGEGPALHPEVIREQLISLMTGMDKVGAGKMADYVLYLIMTVRDAGAKKRGAS